MAIEPDGGSLLKEPVVDTRILGVAAMRVERLEDGKWHVDGTTEELRAHVAVFGIPRPVADRCSHRLLALLSAGHPARKGFVFPVVDEILALEGLRPPTGTGEHREFTGTLLRGLSHKHWFEAGFVPMNLVSIWAKKAREDPDGDLLEGVPDRLEGENDEDRATRLSKHIAHLTTVAAFEERVDANGLTGEWLVFKAFNVTNYYLTLGTHPGGRGRDASDRQLAEEVNKICTDDFPFLVGTFGTPRRNEGIEGTA